MNTVLFKTPHGSHLYGLANENSDEDWYTVIDRGDRRGRYKYAKQSIVNNQDNMVVDLGTWLRFCDNGIPQALEAMFSTVAVHDELTELRNSYRVGVAKTRDTYYRTMENFVKEGDFKRKRHALRLYLNLKDAMRYGRFDPTLTPRQVWWVNLVASKLSDDAILRLVTSNKF